MKRPRPLRTRESVYGVNGVGCTIASPHARDRAAYLDEKGQLTNATPIPVRLASEGWREPLVDPGMAKGVKRDVGTIRVRQYGNSRFAFQFTLCKTTALRFLDLPGRGVAQPGSALRSGRRGRRFKSSSPRPNRIFLSFHVQPSQWSTRSSSGTCAHALVRSPCRWGSSEVDAPRKPLNRVTALVAVRISWSRCDSRSAPDVSPGEL